MKILVVLILLAFGLATEVKTQRLNDAKTQSEDSASLCLCDSASYYESQIRKADSLYKNYLPQYNFEEVKVAMEFFDSLNSCQSSAVSRHQSKFSKLHGLKPNLIDTLTYRLINFNCAKAHYYHAVGLTEKDDIVGACEHYLIALEIMEDMMAKDQSLWKKDKRLKAKVDNPEDYEKIRFVSLIYTRLGQIFYNNNYCDLSILKYQKALELVNILQNSDSKGIILKFLGNSYLLLNKPDSALFYYNISLETNSNQTNRLDIEKSIAQILFDKGEKDSAYILIKNNIDKIVNYGSKESYYAVLGEMYYKDNIYDSAIYYLEKSFTSENISVKISSAINLSAIYDSIMDYDKKVYYDNFISKHTIKDVNKSVERSKFQYVYNNYKERKLERYRMKNLKKTYFIILLLLSLFVLTFIVAMSIKRKYKIKHIELSSSLNNTEAEINVKNEIINQIRGEIEVKEKQLQELKFKQSQIEGKIKNRNVELQKKDDIIKKCEIEISELKNKLERGQTGIKNIEKYLSSEVCLKILSEIKELSDKNIDTSELSSLEQSDFVLLLNSANQNLNNLINNIASTHTKLKKEDLYYVCLTIIGLNDKQISSLFGVTYTAINKRRNKISNILGVDVKKYMYKHI